VFAIDGTWINQNGSTVTFEAADDGTISGTYVSRKGRAASGRRYPLRGLINGEVLNFLVDWQGDGHNLGAITSFSGRLAREPDGQDVIHTLWILVRQWEDSEQQKPTGPWNAFLTNADVFHRQDD